VSLAILVAFAFEGTREWLHNRSLAQEARANLSSELKENRRLLDRIIKVTAGTRTRIERGLEQIGPWLDPAGPAEAPARADATDGLGFVSVIFAEASRSTAETTGAFAHMKLAEVKRYTNIYSLQRELVRAQERFQDQVADIIPRRLSMMSRAELEHRRLRLLVALQYLQWVESSTRALTRTFAVEAGL
jgi:hypothetical protein